MDYKEVVNMLNHCCEDTICPSFDKTCPSVGYQDVVVCVPVEIKPFAEIGKIKTECLGKSVTSHEECKGSIKNTCRFSISQKIRVEVPVEFGAKTEIGEAHIDCECPKFKSSSFDCGCGCK